MDTTPTSIRDLADLATPMAVRVAATLGLAGHAGTVEQLATVTGTAPLPLRRLLDHLVTVGVFDVDADARYRPTDLGTQMCDDGVRRLLDIGCAGGRAELAFTDLLGTVRDGSPAYPRRYGRDFWADLDARPELRRSFDAQMNWRFSTQAAQIAARADWGRFGEILDVGGGDGQLLAEILRAHASVRGRVLDLSPTSDAARARFAAAGFGDRAGAVTGSFFDALPTGADAYLLSDIVHDWDDAHAVRILDGCRRAAGPGGTVLVIEPVRGVGADTGIDLFMLMCFGGGERTVGELADLAAGSGLELRASGPVSEGRTMLEFRVPGQPGAGPR